jgi:hypoxanthine phosphoribosyltransferase
MTLAPTAPPAAGAVDSDPRFAHPSEAEFARLLTFYGIRWEYEPRSFPLRTDGDHLLEAFTPDFYLPDYDQYIELTTLRQSLATIKNRKLRLLRERYPEVNIKLLKRKDMFALLERFGIEPRVGAAMPRIGPVRFTEAQIQERVRELAARISEDYAGGEVVLVGVLRGVVPFMADLMRAIALPVRVDYLALSPYQREGGAMRFTKPLEEPIAGADVIVVEDIVDTGLSLHRLLRYLHRRDPTSVRVCTLLDRRPQRVLDLPIAYAGFEIGDEFLVGYGLDAGQHYRNLPFLATVERMD